MQTIITSHGFGVRQDSNGFFSELAEIIEGARFILFDYNEVLPNGDSIVPSLYDQAKILELAVQHTDSDNITIVAHSQGCVVAGLAHLDEKVKRVILLAPPAVMSSSYLEKKVKNKLGSDVNIEGGLGLPRSDGSTTYFTKGYVESIDQVHPIEIYTDLVGRKPTIIVRATEDEVIGLTDVNTIHGARHIDIATDHNFTKNDARKKVVEIIKKQLT